MHNFTLQVFQYLYNEMSEKEILDFKAKVFSSEHFENDFFLLKKSKEVLDKYLPLESPSFFTINKILAFAKI